ncbi:MAG: hypothetical protein R6V06_04975, partial [Kiritimatiellia bacterium]
MIVPMKHVTILSVASEKLRTIEKIRDLGMMHLSYDDSETPEFRQARREYDEINLADNILKTLDKPLTPSASAAHVTGFIYEDISKSIDTSLPVVHGDMQTKIEAVITLDKLRRKICDQLFKLKKECCIYKPFGEYDISLPQHLTEQGVTVRLFRYSIHRNVELDDKLLVKDFGEHEGYRYGVHIGEGDLPENCEILPAPPAQLNDMQTKFAEAQARIAYITEKLRTAAEEIDFKPEIVRLHDFCNFIAAHDSMHSNENLVWISGWMPAENDKKLLETARKNNWGVLIRNPREDERVPTLLRPPAGFKAMRSLFSALG